MSALGVSPLRQIKTLLQCGFSGSDRQNKWSNIIRLSLSSNARFGIFIVVKRSALTTFKLETSEQFNISRAFESVRPAIRLKCFGENVIWYNFVIRYKSEPYKSTNPPSKTLPYRDSVSGPSNWFYLGTRVRTSAVPGHIQILSLSRLSVIYK